MTFLEKVDDVFHVSYLRISWFSCGSSRIEGPNNFADISIGFLIGDATMAQANTARPFEHIFARSGVGYGTPWAGMAERRIEDTRDIYLNFLCSVNVRLLGYRRSA